ncbi:MAG: HD-GYP domain-containing protein [Actinomycetota bacterium]
MAERSNRRDLRHYLPHVVVATSFVAIVPVVAVSLLQRSGLIGSLLISSILGMALSMIAASLGSALWMRNKGSRDVVFGDLMLWGYFKRVRNEKDVAEMIGLLEDGPAADPGMTPARRIELLQKLAAALEARDPYTHGHTRRVARHSESIARAMGLPREEIAKIRTAAAVHDVGKMQVPEELLNKPDKLTDEEFELMKLHSVHGAEMVDAVGDPELTSIVRHHHERVDGRGYPDRLTADDIPLGARIVAVADTFDAITTTRSYRTGGHHRKAIEVLKKGAGSQLDPGAVDAFLSHYAGRNSFEWWAAATTAPQRLLGRAFEWLRQTGATAIAQTAAATGLAVVVGGAALLPQATPRVAAAPRDREIAIVVAQTSTAPPVPQADAIAMAAASKDGASHPKAKSSEGAGSRRAGRGGGDSTGPDHAPGPGGSASDADTSTAPGGSGSDGESDGGLGKVVDDTVDVVDDTVDDTVDVVDDTVDDTVDVVDDTVDDVGDVVDDLLKLP